jgi:hypothetical protein
VNLRVSYYPSSNLLTVHDINTNHPDFIGGNLLSKATLEGEAVESLKADLKTTQRVELEEEDDHGTSGGFFSTIFGGSTKRTEPKKRPGSVPETKLSTSGDFKYADTMTERDKLQIQLISTICLKRLCNMNFQGDLL